MTIRLIKTRLSPSRCLASSVLVAARAEDAPQQSAATNTPARNPLNRQLCAVAGTQQRDRSPLHSRPHGLEYLAL